MYRSVGLVIILWGTITGGLLHAQIPTLRYGEWVEGEVPEDGSPQTWQFEGRRGDIIMLDVIVHTNSELDPTLQLLSPSGEVVEENDDTGVSLNARLGALRLKESGLYQVVVSSYAGHGDFRLTLTHYQNISPLSLDKPLEVQLTETRPLTYLRIDEAGNNILRLAALAEDQTAAPLMTLYNLDGSLVSSSAYRSAGIVEPFVSRTNTQYIVALEIPFPSADEEQQYAVSLTYSEFELLKSPTSLQAEVTAGEVSVHFFEARQGEQVHVSVTRLDETIAPALYVRSLDGQHFLFSSSGQMVSGLTITLSIPADAVYSIEITNGLYSGQSGDYQLEFTLQ